MQIDTPPSPVLFTHLELNERLLMALDKLGFDYPRPVQRHVIPSALAQKDLKVSAETGSGKTAAFLLPALQLTLSKAAEKSGISVLVLAPTRELAKQIDQQCRQLSEFSGLQTGLITGGEDFKKQQKMIRNKPDILISTPGRLLELLEKGTPDLSQLGILVLDEADRMLDMGFSDDVLAIVDHCKPKRQTLLFSATLNHNGVNRIASRILANPETIALNAVHDQHSQIEQQIVLADDTAHKQKLLAWLLLHEQYEAALVFANSRVQAEQLQGPLRGQKLRAAVLHGEMDQKERKRIMDLFLSGSVNILISTDLSARGLDLPGVDLVVNFDVPRNGVDYTHRIGRTGRGDQTGLAITLVKPMEWNVMSSIERYLKLNCRRRSVPGLEGAYQGPKKLKASGKAAGSKVKPAAKKAAKEKVKIRHRDKKNIGKRRAPSSRPPVNSPE